MPSLKRALVIALLGASEVSSALPGGLHSRKIIFKVVSSGADQSKMPAALLELPDLNEPETLDGGRSGVYHTDAGTITVLSALSTAKLTSNNQAERQREAAREDTHDDAVEALKTALLAVQPEGWTLQRLFINGTSEETAVDPEKEESTDLFFIQSTISFGIRAEPAP